MSVVESGVVDGIGLAENETMKMLITDHLDWQDEYKHLLILQEKINAYIGFCESGQYKEIYTDTPIEHIIFEIHFMFEPTQNTYRLTTERSGRPHERQALLQESAPSGTLHWCCSWKIRHTLVHR